MYFNKSSNDKTSFVVQWSSVFLCHFNSVLLHEFCSWQLPGGIRLSIFFYFLNVCLPLFLREFKKENNNKCVSKTDTNPPFAFQIAFPRGTDFTGFYREGQKLETYNRKFPFESNLESNRWIVVYSFSVTFF